MFKIEKIQSQWGEIQQQVTFCELHEMGCPNGTVPAGMNGWIEVRVLGFPREFHFCSLECVRIYATNMAAPQPGSPMRMKRSDWYPATPSDTATNDGGSW